MGTQVLVKNGETIVLGGIFQTLELNDDRGVPILSSLPVVGHLFKHQQQQRQKRELVIFVTPTILTSSNRVAKTVLNCDNRASFRWVGGRL